MKKKRELPEVQHGSHADDVLQGGAGPDLIIGGKGNDQLFGGAGNDVLFGDSVGDMFGAWAFGARGKKDGYSDYLDGGAGSDLVFGGRGSDTANYSMAENLGPGFEDIGSRDYYDGGSGHDTLRLTLTHGEFLLEAVQQDIAGYQAFLAAHAGPRFPHNPTFHFESFRLGATNFEALEIHLINTAPTAGADAGVTDEDTLLSVGAAAGLLANDHNPDHLDVLGIVAGASVSALGAAVTVNPDGSYRYDPAGLLVLQQLGQGETMSDSFGYTVIDLAGAASGANVIITITGVNDAPIAVGDAFAVNEDGVLSVAAAGVLANDSDVEGDVLGAVLVSGPASGTLTLNGDGSFIYTPNADFNGSDSFSYLASDGSLGSVAAQVLIGVSEVNDAPSAGNDSASVAEDSHASIIDVLGNDSAGPANESGQTLTLVSASALHGAVTINDDGTLGYTPEENYSGDDIISYAIVDDGTTGGASDPRTASGSVAITVTPVNDAPVAAADSVATNEDTAISGNVLTGASGGLDTDADGDALTVTSAGSFLSTLGASVTLLADGTFDYDPAGSAALQALAAGASAVDTFAYTIGDGNGGSDTATVSIGVAGLAEPAASSAKLLPSVGSDATLDYYIRFEGVAGSEWLELGGFGLGFSADVEMVDGGGLRSGKVTAHDVFSQLGSGATTTALIQNLVQGKFLDNVEIEAYRRGAEGKAQLVDEFKFYDVSLTALDTDAAGGHIGTGVGFDFIKFSHGHIDYDAKGSALPADSTGWDFAVHKGGGGDAPDADAAKVLPQDQVSGGSLEYYAHFEGIGWLDLGSFSMGLSSPGIALGSGGAGVGKPSAGPVVLGLGSSDALLDLSDLLFTGKHLAGVEVEVYRAGGDKAQLVDEFVFGDVVISGLDTVNATANVLSFEYGKFSHGHVNEDFNTGKIDPPTVAGWDVETGKFWEGSQPDADVLGAKILPSVGSDATLDYYIRFEGVAGSEWLELGGFGLGFSADVEMVDGGGLRSGKVTAHDVFSQLGSGATTTALIQNLVQGKFLDNVEIEAYRRGAEGKAQLVDEFKFYDVSLTALDTDAAGGHIGTGVGFDFIKFSHGHIDYDAKGSALPADSTGWDFAVHKGGGGDAPDADAAKVLPQDQVSGGSLEYYAHFEGIGWLDLGSFSMGLSSPGIALGSGGAGVGKPSAGPVVLGLGSSDALLDLSDLLFTGKHLAGVEVEVYRAGGDKAQLVDEFVFGDVVISGLDTVNATANVLSFEYGKFSHGHVNEDFNTGKIDPPTVAGWDVETGKFWEGSQPDADVLGAKILPSVGSDATLDYYIRFEGVAGSEWLELGGFGLGFSADVEMVDGGGLRSGKVTAHDVFSQLGSGATTTALIQNLVQGKFLDNVEIEAYRRGAEGKAQLVDEFKFYDVSLTALDTDAAGGHIGTGVGFDFIKFSHGHIDYDAKGSALPADSTGWDFAVHKGGGGDAPDADAAKVLPQDQVSGGSLEYYAHFEGIGWLDLGSFSMGLSSPGIALGSGGAGVGKPSAGPVVLGLGSSDALLDLSDLLFTGKHLAGVEVEVYRAGGDKAQLVDEFVFGDVVISGLDTVNATANVLSFEYGKFSHGHVNEDFNTGKIDPPTVAGWDVETGKFWEAPPPDADVIL